MQRVTIDGNEQVRQAGITADAYLGKAVDSIDSTFGEGYAKAHPELVVAMVQAQVRDFHTSLMAQVAGDFQTCIESSVSELAGAIEYVGQSSTMVAGGIPLPLSNSGE